MRRIFLVLLLIGCTPKTDHSENRLASSGSPYLREHADNPVHWYEWGEEALSRAKKEDKPIIISIGYAACHWCHVMERESFMDPEIAAIMNENFIAIKVDREERPDIDQQYVLASEILSGTAGWPLNAFALPDGKAFHTITYYPKDAWTKLLLQVSKVWKENRTDLEKQANAVEQNLSKINTSLFAGDTLLRFDTPAFLNTVDSWHSQLDLKNGGLKGNMKFPMPSVTEFLLQHSYLNGDKQSMRWVTTTLDAMIRGGLYDHLGGGFSRYTTDSLWHIPHFEKMLYDNAQLVSLYAHAFKITGNKNYERVMRETLRFIEREMNSPEGVFHSSVNADSEGEEGKFYKWTEDEIRSIAGDKALNYYQINDGVLSIKADAPDLIKTKLLDARSKRVHPSIDKKVITSWNAMMIIGFLDAFMATGDRHYLEVARKSISFFDSRTRNSDIVPHVRSADGFLDDYAWLTKAYIQLYQCTLDIKWLTKAETIADIAMKRFRNEASPLFYYAENHLTEYFDNVIPASNSVLADDLLILGELLQREDLTIAGTKAVEAVIGSTDLEGVHIANWARLAETINFSPYQIAIVGDKANEFRAELQRHPLPPSIFLGGQQANLPLLQNKLVRNKTMIYVCKNRTCKLPVEDPKDALRQLK